MNYALLFCAFLTLKLTTLYATTWKVTIANNPYNQPQTPEVDKALKKFSDILSNENIPDLGHLQPSELLRAKTFFWHHSKFKTSLFSRAFTFYDSRKQFNQSNRQSDCLMISEEGQKINCKLIKYNTRNIKYNNKVRSKKSGNSSAASVPFKLWVLQVEDKKFYGWVEKGVEVEKEQNLLWQSLKVDPISVSCNYSDFIDPFFLYSSIYTSEQMISFWSLFQEPNTESVVDNYYEALKQESAETLPPQLDDLGFLKEFMSPDEIEKIFSE